RLHSRSRRFDRRSERSRAQRIVPTLHRRSARAVRRRSRDRVGRFCDARVDRRNGDAGANVRVTRCDIRTIEVDAVASCAWRWSAHSRAGDSSLGAAHMSIGSRLRAVRVILATGVAARAIAWGMAVAFTLVVTTALLDLVVPLSLGLRTALLAVAFMTVFAVA